MKYKLSILLTFFSFSSWSRKPAVEPYVGIESQDYAPVTQGLESAYSFGNQAKVVGSNVSPDFITYAALMGFILVPFAVWYFMKPKTQLSGSTYSPEELSIPVDNVEEKQDKNVA